LQVLGIDCEWVPLTNAKRPVSLLQLATPSGVCILIQLLQLEEIPDTLKDLLADKKYGVKALEVLLT
jgi:ribonuclease D